MYANPAGHTFIKPVSPQFLLPVFPQFIFCFPKNYLLRSIQYVSRKEGHFEHWCSDPVRLPESKYNIYTVINSFTASWDSVPGSRLLVRSVRLSTRP